jgi:PAS domain S-box-containing protein
MSQIAVPPPWSMDARFKALVQNSADIITIHDANGKTTFESPSAAGVLGRPPETRVGRSAFASIHPRDEARAREAFNVVVDGTERPAAVDLCYRHANGFEIGSS